MTTQPTDQAWHVELSADDDTAYAALAGDRIWNGYSIADLEPPFRSYIELSLARPGKAPPPAACLVLRHPDISALIPYGDAEGVAAILRTTNLPQATYILACDPHLLYTQD